VGSSEDLDRLGQVAVPGDRAVVVGVGAGQLGQHLGVARVGLGARRRVPLPIAACRHRVDRQHRVPGRHQRPDEQAPLGLGGDDHLGRVVDEVGDELVEPGHPFNAFREPGPFKPLPLVIFDMDVVMGLRPVVPDEHLPHSHLLIAFESLEPEGTSSSPMLQCSRHVIPPAIQISSPTGRRTI
jgi:hypothetical protein